MQHAQLVTTLRKALSVAILAVVANSLFFISQASAAYPAEFCTFEQVTESSIFGKCTDDKSNGTFDQKEFKKKTTTTFVLNEKGQATGFSEVSCTATITVKSSSAQISGDYLTYEKSESSSSGGGIIGDVGSSIKNPYSCTGLQAGDIDLDRKSVSQDRWINKYTSSMQRELVKIACNDGKNEQCKKQVSTLTALCKSQVWSLVGPGGNLPLKDYRAEYVPAYKDCVEKNTGANSLYPNIKITKNEINKASDTALSGADEDDLEDFSGPITKINGTNTSCDIAGVGWIVCPAMNFLGTLNDSAFGYLESLLEVRPALIQDTATNKAWSAFRDVANVAFVIAFIIIIYSQISGVGVSNYGIKKLIPKLIAAAILVNTSFIITTLMIDLSNIVGSSIYSLLGSTIDIGSSGPGGQNTWTNIMGGVLVGGAVVLLVVAIIIAPVVLLALALILLILVARQALVIMLVVVAPLAFVAFLLPNTESWFQKWWKAFTVVLLVYPVIGLVFGASTLASTILLSVAENGNGDDSQLLAIVALGVLAIPLFAVPVILKGALGAAGSIGGKLAGMQDKVNRGASGRIKGQVGDIKKDVGNRWNLAANNPDSRLGRSKLGSFSRYKTRRDNLRGTRQNEADRAQKSYFASQLTETDENGNTTARALRMQTAAAGGAGASKGAVTRVKAAAQAAQSKEKFENIDNIERTLDYGIASDSRELQKLFEKASKDGNVEEMVAYSRRMGKNGSPGVEAMRKTLTDYSDNIAAKKADPATRAKAEAEEIDMKELLGASDGFAQTGRSFEVWSNNEQPGATFGQISSDPGTYGSISGKRFAGMSTNEQNHALKLVEANDPQAAQRLAQRVYQDETAFGQVKDTPQQTILRLVHQSSPPPSSGPSTP